MTETTNQPDPGGHAHNGLSHEDSHRLLRHMQATYHSLRYLLIVVAMIFLVLLIIYHFSGRDHVPRYSISAYYHNQGRILWFPVRDLFVGAFTSVALLLWAYKGYRTVESRLLNTAGLGLLVVVSCPMEWAQPYALAADIELAQDVNIKQSKIVMENTTGDANTKSGRLESDLKDSRKTAHDLSEMLKPKEDGEEDVSQDHPPTTAKGWLHYAGAFVFFGCIAWVCWFHAKDTLQFIPEVHRPTYIHLYRWTARLMIGVPVTAVIMYFIARSVPFFKAWVFWIEVAGVLVFVAFWAIKSWELRWGTLLLERCEKEGLNLNEAVRSIRRGEYGTGAVR